MFSRISSYIIMGASMVMFSACTTSLLPSVVEPERSVQEISGDEVIALLREDWFILGKKNVSEETRSIAFNRYNKNLLLLLRRGRIDLHECAEKGVPFIPKQFDVIQKPRIKAVRKLTELYDDIIPAVDIPLDGLEERTVIDGFGVPMVGIVPERKMNKIEDITPVHAKGTVRTLTAVMLFSDDPEAKPVLELISRPVQENIKVGQLTYSLAGDATAPLELFWNLTGVDEWRFMGLLRPVELRDTMGLSCMERYDPKRIPVILTHGLMSDPRTFANLINRLVRDPDIARNYQFWFYGYPTGVSWTLTALEFRKSLAEARNRLDPKHKNKNWDRMVLIGHSMGGLITHYSQCEEPWLMLRPVMKPEAAEKYLTKEYLHKPLTNAPMSNLHDVYFFEPVKAARVMYFATPHQGAPMASFSIVEWLLKFIQIPQRVMEESLRVVTLNENMLLMDPDRLTSWFTSVNQLARDSESIRGLQGLEVRDVPTHSIIGDRGKGDTPDSSDGVVPYYSSHITWGSENIVPSGHGVQEIPETAEITRKYLREHLKSYKIKLSEQ